MKLTVLATASMLLALGAPDLRREVLDAAGVTTGSPTAAASAATPPVRPGDSPPGAPERDAEEAPALDAVATALARLEKEVPTRSHPDALRHAVRAYYGYRAANPGKVRKPYLYFVDFGLDSRTPRGYVFDMQALTVVEGPFTVAHGRGSVRGGGEVPTLFSNRRGSNATSLGLYLAQETYGFRGKSGGLAYQSVGLRLQGVSGHFNSAARARGIVVHGAPYVTPQKAGRSEGCPAMTQALAQRLLPKIANGGMVFHFSPRDHAWLRGDPWVNSAAGTLAAAD